MNAELQALKERRSVRKYKADMVPQELIDQVIDAGLYAASGHGEQDSIIVAVTNKEVRDKLSQMNRAIMGTKEEFASEEGKQLLKEWGVEGEYEGVGHCILGYADGPVPQAAPRKANRVFYVK